MSNKIGRKKVGMSKKRRLAITKLQEKYGNDLAILEIRKYLVKDYGITASRQQIYQDVKWLSEHDLSEESEGNRNLLLEVSYAELKIQYKEARDNYDSTSDSAEKLQWSKRMTDISKLKHTVEKELGELKIQEKKSAEKAIVYNISIGKPREIDPELYAKKQAEIRAKLAK